MSTQSDPSLWRITSWQVNAKEGILITVRHPIAGDVHCKFSKGGKFIILGRKYNLLTTSQRNEVRRVVSAELIKRALGGTVL